MFASVKQSAVENRQHPRKECSVSIEHANYSETNRKAFISNISQGGAFVHTRDFPDIGQDVLMKVQLPNLPKPMAIMGEIVHRNSDGMGVKFNMRLGASAINSFIKSI